MPTEHIRAIGDQEPGTSPKAARSVPTPSREGPVTKADELTLKDWAECRFSIDRFDKLLEDLRKYGFSLVTGLITAVALFGRSGPSTTAIGAGFGAAMVLIGALFFIDTYYEVLLSGAVERALDIELRTQPWVRVTRTISKNSGGTDAVLLILFLYLALLSADLVLGLVNIASAGWSAVWPLVLLYLLLLPSMVLYWRFAALKCHFYKQKPRSWPEDAPGALTPPAVDPFASSVYSVLRMEQ